MNQTQQPSLAITLLREEAWLGELRLNWVRLIALAGLYLQHVLVSSWSQGVVVSPEFNRAVDWICSGWLLAILAVFYCLYRRWMPPYLKFGSALWDLTACGVVISLGDGPRSGLLVLLPVLVGASAVRLSMGLVWFSSMGAILCYLAVLGRYAWFQVGFEKYYATPGLRIPRTQECIMIIALVVAGLVAGQVVRQAHRLAAAGSNPRNEKA